MNVKKYFKNLFSGAKPKSKKKVSCRQKRSSDHVENRVWTLPIPIRSKPESVAKFEEKWLPDVLSRYALDIAERTSAPIDYVIVSLVVALASIIGRRCGICPKKKDLWLVVPNVWGMLIGKTSSGKSPALSVIGPILKRLESVDSNPVGGSGEPSKKRLFVNETTVPRLIHILRDNPLGLLLYRDELRGFFEQLNQIMNGKDRAFYLESWNGYGSYSYDTIKDGHISCESMCISILGGIQPSSLDSLLSHWRKKGVGEDGLLQRFQLLVYPDPKIFVNIDREPDEEAEKDCVELFRKLEQLSVEGSVPGASIPALRFAPDAQYVFNDWFDMIHQKTRSERSEDLSAHFGKYNSLMPSLALIMYLVDRVSANEPVVAVDLPSIEKAISWCRYLESHARRVYLAGAGGSEDVGNALLKRIIKGDLLNPFTVRDVVSKGWSKLTTNSTVEAAIQILIEHHYLRVADSKPTGKGGRPTKKFLINPRISEC